MVTTQNFSKTTTEKSVFKLNARKSRRKRHDFDQNIRTKINPIFACEKIQMVNGNFVKLYINGIQIDALVDTGSYVTIINSRFLKKHNVLKSLRINKSRERSAVAANNTAIKFEGEIRVNLSFSNRRDFIPTRMQVTSNIGYDMILGNDFLRENQAIIDLSKSTLSLSTKSRDIKITRDVVIPPESEIVFLGSVGKNVPENIDGIVYKNKRLSFLPFECARVLATTKNNTIPVRCINTSKEPFTILKNTKIGRFTPLTPNSKVTVISEKHEEETQPLVSNVKERERSENPIVDLNDSDVTEEQKVKLRKLFDEYSDVFQKAGVPLRKTPILEHEIRLKPNQKPIRSQMYRTSPKQREIMDEHITDMLNDGIIRPSMSSWSSPVVLVEKPDKKGYRFCVDYRKLNAVTEDDVYPLPRIDDTLDSLGQIQPRYLSTFDLQSGYWEIGLSEESKPLSAFICHAGLYEFERLPFGLKSAGATFSRMIESVFRGMSWKKLFLYLDDIIVASHTFEDHLRDVKEVLERLRNANLTLKPSKCFIARKEVKYLGFIVSKDGIRVDPGKCAAVQEFPIPKNVKQTRSFLGLANYYRKFIKGFAHIVKPMTELTRKDRKFKWSTECQKSFETIKKSLTSAPILAYPDFEKPFILYTDASSTAVGMVLSQFQEEKERVIAYAGRSLKKHERNYPITELEGLAVVQGIKHFDVYLRYSKFKIVTDHDSLRFLLTQRHPKGRLCRWILALTPYNFVIEHRKGSCHNNADALSRRPYEEQTNDTEIEFPTIGPPQSTTPVKLPNKDLKNASVQQEKLHPLVPAPQTGVINHSSLTDEKQNPIKLFAIKGKYDAKLKPCPSDDQVFFVSANDVSKLQRQDDSLQTLITYLESDELPSNSKNARRLLIESDDYVLIDGTLYHLFYPKNKRGADGCHLQLVVPDKLKYKVLSSLHDDITMGHGGIQKTYLTLRVKYFWKGQFADVVDYVRSCVECLSKKTPKDFRAPLLPLEVVGSFDRVCVDCITSLPVTTRGNKNLVTFIDSFTGWPEAFPVPDITAPTIARLLFDEIICRHGVPSTLLSDRGSNFLSDIVAELCKYTNMSKINTSSYHPMTNGQVEKLNGLIMKTLSNYVSKNQKDWDLFVNSALMGLRVSPNTSSMMSPFFMLYGREAKLPIDVELLSPVIKSPSMNYHVQTMIRRLTIAQETARENIEKAKERMKDQYDKKARNVKFQVGDRVFVYNPAIPRGCTKKLSRLYHGPFTIVDLPTPVNAKLRRTSDNHLVKTLVHVNRLKMGYDRKMRPPDTDVPELSDTDDTELQENDFPTDSFVTEVENNDEQSETEDMTDLTQNTDEIFEVEKVLRGRYRPDGSIQYLIKWKDFPHSQNTWEPVSNLNDATMQYIRENKIKVTGKRK